MNNVTRRNFVKTSAAVSSFMILPSHVWADSPNEKLCTAHIGIGGKGRSDTSSIASHPHVQVIGLCDVDTALSKSEAALQKYSSAQFFQDYREMFSELGDKIDAVSVSTPDHTHYPATLAAMEMGKHAYTQKPLTHTIEEGRHLLQIANERKLVTQMGIQNHGSGAYRSATEIIQSGVLGKIRKVHAWSNKNWGFDGAPYQGEDPIPASLDWNLWLGTAPVRPYLGKKYHPKNWRRIIDFGCGTLGDMGVHIIDTPFRALELQAATDAETTCRAPNGFSHPESNIVNYGFAPTKYTTDDFRFTWYDGQNRPDVDYAELTLENGKIALQGSLFIGEHGRMLLPHCSTPIVRLNDANAKSETPVLKTLNHYHEFIDAIEGKGQASADFAYATPIMESLHLGVIAAKFPKQKLVWDAKAVKVTNLPEANEFIRKEYRTL
ncbi:putative oxidoreductase YcjS [Planctomycetes bacterium CA13]|uniref:Putative oxidoreductase YcjS n=2 Tax=Novipirellula herctigrandis TaxID=2527986 RepID=A0A5C5ZAT3_9BACT|nr:putative oxidoreductase YcjS [Planctomycetes bacterium CA13]